MSPSERRIVELSNQDRHLLERIAKGLDGLKKPPPRPISDSERARRFAAYQQFVGVPFPEDVMFGPGHEPYPRPDGDFTLLGPETFTNEDGTVISHKGDNFYKACGHPVKQNPDGSGSSCVKRVGHPRPEEHEDYDGRINTGFSD